NLCRETRNLLAHSSWDYSKNGLQIASLEDAARKGGVQSNIQMRDVPRQSLRYVENYFWEVFQALETINQICAVRNGLLRPPEPSKPTTPSRRREHTFLFPEWTPLRSHLEGTDKLPSGDQWLHENQARWLPYHRPQGWRPRAALQPPRK